jgi:DNA-binding response OmpR family regulator
MMRILVVDDEVRLATGLARTLRREGFAVDVAHDGEQALWLGLEHPYDVIVLDIMLPKLNGFVACRRLREADVWTPILMLTAKDGEHDVAEALDTGADDHLAKPFSLVVLLARVRALLRRSAVERPSVLEVGDLRLDPAAHTCTRGDHDINLTGKEFAVLEYLMRRAGAAVSKAELLAHAWDVNFDGDPNVVEVHLSGVRRKIDASFDRASIETIHGVGYRMTEPA